MFLKQKVVKGFAWVLLERFSTQGVPFFVSLVLARLLAPADYGTIALLTLFIAISQVLADSGLGQALICNAVNSVQDAEGHLGPML